jgi:hypothetical protein
MSRYREWDLSCKVYVGNLGSSASKHEIESAFSKYGPLRNVWVARNPPGFAFVEFEDPRDAEDAVRGLDGTWVGVGSFWFFKWFVGAQALLWHQSQGGNVQWAVAKRRRTARTHEILQGSATAVVFSPRLRPTPSPATHLILHRHTQLLQLHPPSVVTALNFNNETARLLTSCILQPLLNQRGWKNSSSFKTTCNSPR